MKIKVLKADCFKAIEQAFPGLQLSYQGKYGAPDFIELEGIPITDIKLGGTAPVEEKKEVRIDGPIVGGDKEIFPSPLPKQKISYLDISDYLGGLRERDIAKLVTTINDMAKIINSSL